MIETLAFLTYPAIDPVAIEIGPIAIKWYGLSYMFGLLLGWQYVKRLLATPRLWQGPAPLQPAQADDLLLWLTLAVVVGGSPSQVRRAFEKKRSPLRAHVLTRSPRQLLSVICCGVPSTTSVSEITSRSSANVRIVTPRPSAVGTMQVVGDVSLPRMTGDQHPSHAFHRGSAEGCCARACPAESARRPSVRTMCLRMIHS